MIYMKATGVVRRVDELGRVVLPCELRRTMHINDRDSLEVYVDGDRIILKKYDPACIFTGNTDDLIDYKGRKISKQAIAEMAELAGL
jgi:transcriptional pleiotropic regulator of transition state genes